MSSSGSAGTSPAGGPGSAAAAKAALRRAALRRRAARPAPAGTADALLAGLAPLLAGSPLVAAYASFGTEPPTDALRAAARPRLLLPVLLPGGDLDWAGPDGRRLGVEAVAACGLVVVPALAVDRRGVRLGRGGGSYDRALARVPPGVPVVALLHDGELVDALPSEPHDVRVTAVVTPSGGLQQR